MCHPSVVVKGYWNTLSHKFVQLSSHLRSNHKEICLVNGSKSYLNPILNWNNGHYKCPVRSGKGSFHLFSVSSIKELWIQLNPWIEIPSGWNQLYPKMLVFVPTATNSFHFKISSFLNSTFVWNLAINLIEFSWKSINRLFTFAIFGLKFGHYKLRGQSSIM